VDLLLESGCTVKQAATTMMPNCCRKRSCIIPSWVVFDLPGKMETGTLPGFGKVE
jgi:hypothetical protein